MRALQRIGRLVATGILSLGMGASAATINVPASQPTIQAGINAASTGDTVLVAPGTYYENIDFKGKAITVTSSGGASVTTINGSLGSGLATAQFITNETPTSILSGFTITGGGTGATYPDFGVSGIFAYYSAPTIANNTITANTCMGIFAWIASPQITNNVISENTRPTNTYCSYAFAAGIYIFESELIGNAYPEVIGNIIQNNTSGGETGGLQITDGTANVVVRNNVISGNTGGLNGGVELEAPTISLVQNLIYGNYSPTSDGGAGGVEIYGASGGSAANVLVAGNTIANNAAYGPGPGFLDQLASQLLVNGGQATLVNNLIVGSSTTVPALGCGIKIANSLPIILDHNDVYNPQGPAYGGVCVSPSPAATNLSGYGNISADPLFTNATGNNYTLLASSPGIDAGNNSASPMPVTDLAGNSRIQNATGASSPIVDMGVYEFSGSSGVTTATTLTPLAWQSAAHTPITFTIMVIPSTGTIPAGSMLTLGDPDTSNFQTYPLGTGGTATVQFPGLAAGTYPFVATYNGTPPSQSVKLYIELTGPALPTPNGSMTASPEPSFYSDMFTLTATVTPPSGNSNTPGGTVNFSIDGAVVASNVALSAGAASYIVPANNTYGIGPHTLTAAYSGDTNFSAATFTGSHTVSLIPTQTSLALYGDLTCPSATPPPAFYYYGQDFYACTSVSNTGDTNGSAPVPTGRLDFNIDGVLNCYLILQSGLPCQGPNPDAGTHQIQSVYEGDAVHGASSSASLPLGLGVVQDPTSTSISSSNYAPTQGQTITLTASVAAIAPGNYAPPVGPVAFYDGTTLLGMVALVIDPGGGFFSTASFTTSSLSVGTHNITASYTTTTDFLGSVSTQATITVLAPPPPDATATTLVTSASSVYQGQSVTFTATVTATIPANYNYGPPVGPVAFYDGSTLIGTGTLVIDPRGGLFSTATFTTSTLSAGGHSITASYATTTDFLGSVSTPALSQMILPLVALPSTVTLASSLNPAGYGQTVSFTAAITVNPPPGNTQPLPSVPATGMVSFYDGATLLSTSNVDPTTGIAMFNTASLAIGTHVITAQYLGDGNYAPGGSNTVLEVVHAVYSGPADFTLTIAQNPFIEGVGLVQSTMVTVTPTNGWTNDVAVTCPQNLPYESTCTLAQTTVNAANNWTTTLVLSTIAPHDCGSSTPYFTGALRLRLGGAALAGVLLFMLPRRRRVMKGLLLALLCVLPGVVGCAGHCTDLGTRPGTYTIPITATGVGTSTVHTVNLQMQVNL